MSYTPPRRLRSALLLGLALPLAASLGCGSLLTWIAVPFLYEEAVLPESQTWLDLPYREDPDADPAKHRFDLFLPEGSDWPLVVFVHGGGWRHGDRTLVAGGADVYRNIGRYLASNGVAAASISYRLQPDVSWQQQVDDVSAALRSVADRIPGHGGNPNALFLMGHSAGAHLSARLGVDRERLSAAGIAPERICGLIPVSGAALDLGDQGTYDAGADPDYYTARFGDDRDVAAWRADASVVTHLSAASPPALILYAGGESDALIRQAHVLQAAYSAVGAESTLLEVPGEDHSRIVLTLSRADKTAGPAILDFVRGRACGGAAEAPAEQDGADRS